MSLLDKNKKIATIPLLKIARIPFLSDLIHLYPAPTDHLDAGEGVCRASFFNAEAVDGGKGPRTATGNDVSAVIGDPSGPPRWLFVLGSTDNGVQHLLHGKTRFTELVLQELLQPAVRAGRRPTLVGPAFLIERLRLLSRKRPSLRGVDLLPFCPYPQFERLLLASEYVFYWNVFSGSSLLRIINALPAFYFDRGHVSRWFPRFYEAGLRFYFSGWEPTFLDQRDSLDPGLLGELAEKQRSDEQRGLRICAAITFATASDYSNHKRTPWNRVALTARGPVTTLRPKRVISAARQPAIATSNSLFENSVGMGASWSFVIVSRSRGCLTLWLRLWECLTVRLFGLVKHQPRTIFGFSAVIRQKFECPCLE